MGRVNWIALLVATLLFLLGGACVLGIALQLPGTWIFLALALAVELLDGLYLPPGERVTFARSVWLTGIALAVLGELLEFFSGVLGVKKGGGSRRGLVGAFVGAFLGVFLTPLFVFVPFLGVFLGVLLGTFAGALIGELSHERSTLETSFRPALWAALGRLLGTTGKMALATVIWLVFTVSAFRL
jgi:uncharacterized protein YqgC (DUF456 family)